MRFEGADDAVGLQQTATSFSLSLIDLNLPMSPFNFMSLFSPAPRTEAHSYLTQTDDDSVDPEIFDLSDFSTAPMGVSAVDA